MVKRGDKLPAEFRQEWLERHRELKRAARKVVAAITTAAPTADQQLYDGISSMYYGTAAEARAALGDDPSKVEVACSEQLVAQQGDAERLIKTNGQLKLVRAYIRRKDLTFAQFKDYWLKTHAGLYKRVIAETPVLRSMVSFALPPETGGNEPSFDAIVELYFPSADDIAALFAAPLLAQMRKDEENFVQVDAPSVGLVAEEFLL